MKTLFTTIAAVAAIAVGFFYVGQPAMAKDSYAKHAGHEESVSERHDYTEVTAEELVEMMKNPDVLVFDSRGGKYFSGEVIKGARPVSVSDTNAENLDNIVPSKDTPIVFYCSNEGCPASKYGALRAKDAGYTNLYKFPGGIEEWKEKGLPTEEYQKEG